MKQILQKVKKIFSKKNQNVGFGGQYKVTCLDKDGNVKWVDFEHNLVVDQGLTLFNQILFAGSTAPTYYAFPTTLAYTPVAGDTMATYLTSAGEFTAYSNSTRPVYTPTVSGVNVTNTTAKFSFAITGGGTIRGIALVSANNIKSNTSGNLISAMRLGSDKTVASGDTLQVEYNFVATSIA